MGSQFIFTILLVSYISSDQVILILQDFELKNFSQIGTIEIKP